MGVVNHGKKKSKSVEKLDKTGDVDDHIRETISINDSVALSFGLEKFHVQNIRILAGIAFQTFRLYISVFGIELIVKGVKNKALVDYGFRPELEKI